MQPKGKCAFKLRLVYTKKYIDDEAPNIKTVGYMITNKVSIDDNDATDNDK